MEDKMDDVQMMLGDCLDKMSQIADGSVDMILCDLPYGTTANAWDAKIPLAPLWAQYRRLVKTGGAVLLFAQQPFAAELIQSNRKWFRYEWIWQKSNATGFYNARKMPMKAHELILVFYQRLPTYHPQMRTGFRPYRCRQSSGSANYHNIGRDIVTTNQDGTRYPIDIVKFASTPKRPGMHPTEKPVDLLRYLIRTYTDEGEVILDNCMGSGSTGVAAVLEGRKFIGIERNAQYFAIANDRVEDAKNKLLEAT